MASRSHRDPKTKRRQVNLRHLSRQRDEWRCTKCGRVSCPRGQECFYYSRPQRKLREWFGSKKEEVPDEFEDWKRGFCKGGQDCILRMHHLVQLSHGGDDGLDNVVTLCTECESEIEHDDTPGVVYAIKNKEGT